MGEGTAVQGKRANPRRNSGGRNLRGEAAPFQRSSSIDGGSCEARGVRTTFIDGIDSAMAAGMKEHIFGASIKRAQALANARSNTIVPFDMGGRSRSFGDHATTRRLHQLARGDGETSDGTVPRRHRRREPAEGRRRDRWHGSAHAPRERPAEGAAPAEGSGSPVEKRKLPVLFGQRIKFALVDALLTRVTRERNQTPMAWMRNVSEVYLDKNTEFMSMNAADVDGHSLLATAFWWLDQWSRHRSGRETHLPVMSKKFYTSYSTAKAYRLALGFPANGDSPYAGGDSPLELGDPSDANVAERLALIEQFRGTREMLRHTAQRIKSEITREIPIPTDWIELIQSTERAGGPTASARDEAAVRTAKWAVDAIATEEEVEAAFPDEVARMKGLTTDNGAVTSETGAELMQLLALKVGVQLAKAATAKALLCPA